jgi:hypothetical protein
MDIKGKQPSALDQYEGIHRGSVGSNGSGGRVQWDQLERRPSGESVAVSGTWSRAHGELRRRRWVMRFLSPPHTRLTMLKILSVAASGRIGPCGWRQQH